LGRSTDLPLPSRRKGQESNWSGVWCLQDDQLVCKVHWKLKWEEEPRSWVALVPALGILMIWRSWKLSLSVPLQIEAGFLL
jgi:hypothetical protein